jgi:surface antigen
MKKKEDYHVNVKPEKIAVRHSSIGDSQFIGHVQEIA